MPVPSRVALAGLPRTDARSLGKAARRFALAAGLGQARRALPDLRETESNHLPNSVLSNVSEKTIAVLPFENLSEDKGNAYFAGGVREGILTKLAQVRGLKVMSRSSTKKSREPSH